MNALKLKTKISCNTCGCSLTKTKTIKVSATTEAEARTEATEKITSWKESIKGKNCKVCQTIIDEVAG